MSTEKHPEGRLRIFTEESFSSLLKLAGGHYLDLCAVPKFRNVQSLTDLVDRADGYQSEKMRHSLAEVLEGRMGKREKRNIATAVIDEDFSAIDQSNTELMITTLGYRLVMERASIKARTKALLLLTPNVLERFGMSPQFRDILAKMMHTLGPNNAEYLRFYRRAKSGTMPQVYSGDAFRERQRLQRAFSSIADEIESADLDCEDTAENDFANYLRTIALGNEEHSDTAAKKACELFYAQHRNFPLIIIPPTASYLGDEAETDIGNDPEYTMVWSTPAHLEKSRLWEPSRDNFAKALRQRFPESLPEEDIEAMCGTTIRTGNEIASFGSNMQAKSDAVEIPGLVLHIEGSNDEREEKRDDIRKLLRSFLQSLPDFTKKEKFSEIEDIYTLFHELVHRGAYPEEGCTAESLGLVDDKLCEAKSNFLAATALPHVYRQKAKQDFGNQWRQAINACLIGNTLYEYKLNEKKSEDFPYWLSGVMALNALASHGVFKIVETGNKRKKSKVVLDEKKIGQDLSPLFAKLSERILEVYHLASHGNKSKAINLGEAIAREEENELVQLLSKQINK